MGAENPEDCADELTPEAYALAKTIHMLDLFADEIIERLDGISWEDPDEALALYRELDEVWREIGEALENQKSA